MKVTMSLLAAMAIGAAGLKPEEAVAQPSNGGLAPQQAYRAGDLYLPTSKVYALVGKTGLGHEHGVTGAIQEGHILLGASKDAGELVFDMSSFVADTDAARRLVGLDGSSSESTRREVTANMLGASVLNAANYPRAIFKIDSALPEPGESTSGAKRYRLNGQLTLQKATRPLSILAEVDQKNGWNRVRGRFSLKQTDFGIKPFTKAFGAVGVADVVTVWGELWLAPEAGGAPQQE